MPDPGLAPASGERKDEPGGLWDAGPVSMETSSLSLLGQSPHGYIGKRWALAICLLLVADLDFESSGPPEKEVPQKMKGLLLQRVKLGCRGAMKAAPRCWPEAPPPEAEQQDRPTPTSSFLPSPCLSTCTVSLLPLQVPPPQTQSSCPEPGLLRPVAGGAKIPSKVSVRLFLFCL